MELIEPICILVYDLWARYAELRRNTTPAMEVEALTPHFLQFLSNIIIKTIFINLNRDLNEQCFKQFQPFFLLQARPNMTSDPPTRGPQNQTINRTKQLHQFNLVYGCINSRS